MKAIIFLVCVLAISVLSKTPEEWRSRTIYQILTDRFAKSDNSGGGCPNGMDKYCGGTFKGIQNNLEYIKGMGFDAIWISPIVKNKLQGYHGYHAENLYQLNEHFGTEDDFKALVKACHDSDIWVMVDVVANHMTPIDNNNFGYITPFNKPEFYNPPRSCDTVRSQEEKEVCWLSGLSDLNQDLPFVRQKLLEWIKNMVATYNIDGLRIDTIPYVKKAFWSEFTKAAGVYTVGENFDGSLPYVAGYQGPVNGMLNYPMYFNIERAFKKRTSMRALENYLNGGEGRWPNSAILGNFIDNHDVARWLNGNPDQNLMRAALAFMMTTEGIPIVYYGTEQGFAGGNDPLNREPMWNTWSKTTDTYVMIAKINKLRKVVNLNTIAQTQRYADDSVYAFSRGKYFFAFTNTNDYQERKITYHPYANGDTLCNLYYPKDCVQVQNNGFSLHLKGGENKIFVPAGELGKLTL